MILVPFEGKFMHCVVIFCAGSYVCEALAQRHSLHRFEQTLITLGRSVEECAIDPAMDAMGRRQSSPS